MINVADSVEEFCGRDFATSEQHVDARASRVSRDNSDCEKMDQFFASHPPFIERSDLISIGNGVIADERINCHNAESVGIEMMRKSFGLSYEELKLRRSETIMPLGAVTSAIKIDKRAVTIIRNSVSSNDYNTKNGRGVERLLTVRTCTLSDFPF